MRPKSFGQLPSGKRLDRIRSSPNYREGSFQNVFETPMMMPDASYPKMLGRFFFGKDVSPPQNLPAVKTDLKAIDRNIPSITWFGHSSYLLVLNGKFILVDPVMSERASPFQWTGSKAFDGTDIYTVDDLPRIDLLILTHDHYDHLDYGTLNKLKDKVPLIFTSLGVGAHLEYWGFDPAIIREFDWWEKSSEFVGFEITAVPARHFSGRLFTRYQSLWSAFVIKTGGKTIFVGGDSGYDASFKKIGSDFGGFDFAILECGQYDAWWPHIHMMPEESVLAAVDLNAKQMMAVHWGKFRLANHTWTDPIERALKQAAYLKMPIATPRIGDCMALDKIVTGDYWWRK